MKKLILSLILMLMATPVMAQSNIDEAVNLSETPIKQIVDKIPPMKNAVTINTDGQVGYASLFEVLSWKGLNLDVGYSPKQAIVAGLSYKIVSLEDLGVDVPILKYINLEPGVGVSWDRIDAKDFRDTEEDFLFYLNLIDIRFY